MHSRRGTTSRRRQNRNSLLFPSGVAVSMFRNGRNLGESSRCKVRTRVPQISLLIPSPFADCLCLCGSDERKFFPRELFPAAFPEAGILSGVGALTKI